MSEPPSRKTCESGDSFIFEVEPNAMGEMQNGKMSGKIKLIAKIIIFLMLFPASLLSLLYLFVFYLAFGQPTWWMDFHEWLDPEEKIDFVPGPPYEGPHTMLFMGGDDPLKSSFVHPLLKAENEEEKWWENFRVMSVREGDILKVVVREIKDPKERSCSPWVYWHISDPERRNFAGMAAKYFTGGPCRDLDGIIFEDGSVFCSHKPPPGVIRIGTPARYNQMRWRRFWKNYYLVAVYRGEARVISEWLMREKDGKNIGMILGESNLQDIDNTLGIYGSWEEQGISIGLRGTSERYRLVPVTLEEIQNLPPDFPRHLLRGWQ